MTVTSPPLAPPADEAAAPAQGGLPAVEVKARVIRSPGLGIQLRRRLTALAGEGGAVALVAAATYLTIAFLLAFKYEIFVGDAVARMANGWYVLYSRDPHLAAIGFVWNPLPSVIDMAFLLFKDIWPALASRDLAGAFMSVACMVGAVHQLRAALAEWGVARLPRLVLTALFAFNPMILYYAGNGMSEALFLFTLIAMARYFARWIRTNDLRSLVYAGSFAGLCYLARSEGVLPALTMCAFAFMITYRRGSAASRQRVMAGVTDALIVVLPFLASFVTWAVASYVITGQAFAQFTSQYGNSAQLSAIAYHRGTLGAAIGHEVSAVSYLSPLLIVVFIAAVVQATRRRDLLMLAPLAAVGGGLAFDLVAFARGDILNSLRYYIAAIPLGILLLGTVLASAPHSAPTAVPAGGGGRYSGARVITRRAWWRPQSARVPLIGGFIALLAIGPSLATSAAAMLNPRIGPEESQYLSFVFKQHITPTERDAKNAYSAVLGLDRDIEDLHLPDGDIVVDNFALCVPNMIVSMTDPRVFVIPNDRDYQKVLADPITFNVHYILESDPGGYGGLTSIPRAYPTLYNTGAGFTTLARQIPAMGLCPAFRLFRVTGHSGFA